MALGSLQPDAVFESRRDGFVVSTDRRRLDVDLIHRFLTTCYWRDGPALLAGLVRCGRCGRRMVVRYGGPKPSVSYTCTRGSADYGEGREMLSDFIDWKRIADAG